MWGLLQIGIWSICSWSREEKERPNALSVKWEIVRIRGIILLCKYLHPYMHLCYQAFLGEILFLPTCLYDTALRLCVLRFATVRAPHLLLIDPRGPTHKWDLCQLCCFPPHLVNLSDLILSLRRTLWLTRISLYGSCAATHSELNSGCLAAASPFARICVVWPLRAFRSCS